MPKPHHNGHTNQVDDAPFITDQEQLAHQRIIDDADGEPAVQYELPGMPARSRDDIWLIPSGGGYALRRGATGDIIGYVCPESRRSIDWHISRLDLYAAVYQSAQDAATALVNQLREEGKLT